MRFDLMLENIIDYCFHENYPNEWTHYIRVGVELSMTKPGGNHMMSPESYGSTPGLVSGGIMPLMRST
eukprot:SAG22_NODE_22270_length_232_cov_10.135338_1_plen_67_part_01